MPKAFAKWTVLPHDPIHKWTENLWTVTGDVPGMPLRRNMTMVREADGSVLIHSPVALDEPAMAEIDAWGPVTQILVPNGYHRLDAANFRRRYPAAKLYCPAGARGRVEEVAPVDGTFESLTPTPTVWIESVDGVRGQESVLAVRSADGVTLVFGDLLFNQPHLPGFKGAVVRLLGSTGGPKVTAVARMVLVKEKPACAQSLGRLAEHRDLVRLVPGHGLVVQQHAASTLKQVAAAL